MDKKILIKNARAIVSCDGEDRVYRDADMLIEGPRILAIGRDLMNQRTRYQEENGSRRRSR